MALSPDASAIQIKVDNISQLFNTLDPFPFRERDLDKEAEEFIVSWGRELPKDTPINIVIHVAASTSALNSEDLIPALRRFFNYRADLSSRELRELFRIGRLSLAIGVTVLVVCVSIVSTLIRSTSSNQFLRIFEEGTVILGWVANWKPIEIFLYDWWPIKQRKVLYQRLAQATVVVRTDNSEKVV